MDFELKLATIEACRYACKNWHYSGCLPAGKMFKFAIYEHQKFVGVIIYGLGSGAMQAKSYKKFGINEDEFCELVRIAMTKHEKPVSKYLALSLKLLKKYNTKLKIVSSFADPKEGHHGGIYQATNWIYTGKSQEVTEYFYNNKWNHTRSIYGKMSLENLKKLKTRVCPGENRYLFPLDEQTRKAIEHLKLPYIKRVEHENNASNFQLGESGVVPTNTLHLQNVKENNLENNLNNFNSTNEIYD